MSRRAVSPTTSAAQTRPLRPVRIAPIVFQYVGRTAMQATGAATGRQYRFDRPGAQIAIAPADKASLAHVPNLRQIFTP